MATYPQAMIPAFPAGAGPLPATFAGWVQQPFQFLTQQPVFRAIQQLAGGQALTSATFDPLQVGGTAGDILEDPYAGWSTTTTATQAAWSYLVPYTGLYEITVTVPIVANAIWLTAAVGVSGGTPQWLEQALCPSGIPGGCTGSLIVACVGGQDYLQAGTAVSANATTRTTAAGTYPSLEIAYLSGG